MTYVMNMEFYVIDETNLETHGTWSEFFDKEHIIPNDDPKWLENVLDRAKSMYERDKNHPSILIWSCGNESYGGKDIFEMSEYFRSVDPSRLVHYEGVSLDTRYPDTTDMVSRMYTPAKDIEEYLKKHTEKPFILCEYAHAMVETSMKDLVIMISVEMELCLRIERQHQNCRK